MAKIKSGANIFYSPQELKKWAMELLEACGSIVINKKPNMSKIDALVQKFLMDFQTNMEIANAAKEEE